MVNIVPILKNKKEFLELLLLADEQESMIDLYLERGEMYALYDGDLKAACVITDEGNGVYEIKNIATYPHYQRKGYGKRLIEFLLVGTAEDTYTEDFYKQCGFTYSHRIPNFFTDNYDHPMYEDGKLLKDMVYLKISKNG